MTTARLLASMRDEASLDAMEERREVRTRRHWREGVRGGGREGAREEGRGGGREGGRRKSHDDIGATGTHLQVSLRKHQTGQQDHLCLSLPPVAGLKHRGELFAKQWVGKLPQIQLQEAGHIVDIGGVQWRP